MTVRVSYSKPALAGRSAVVAVASWCALAALFACRAHPAPAASPTAPMPDPTAAPAAVPWHTSGVDWTSPPPPEPAAEPRIPEPETFALANGMTAVVIRNPRLPLVSLVVVNPLAGSAADPRERAGLAGLTADLLDEGAGDRDALALARELERLGARLDVGIGADSATVSLDTLSDTLAPSLALLADVLARPRLDRADFERVAAERASRIALRRDDPDQVAELVLDRVLFRDHPYAWPGLGMADTLRAITLSEARTFYRRRWNPARMTLVAAGDVPDDFPQLLAGTLGAWRPAGPAPAALPPAALPSTRAGPPPPRLVVVDKPGAPQSVVRIARVAMARHDPRFHVASTANTALGGSFAARLNNRLREQLGYTYGAFSRFWFGRHGGAFAVVTSLETAHTLAGLREALALIESMRAEPIPGDELAKAAALRVGRLQQRFETNAVTAAAFADLAAFDLPLGWYDGYAAAARAITAADVRAFAGAMWPSEALTVVVVGDLARLRDGLLGLFGSFLEYTPEGEPVRPDAPGRLSPG